MKEITRRIGRNQKLVRSVLLGGDGCAPTASAAHRGWFRNVPGGDSAAKRPDWRTPARRCRHGNSVA